MYPRAGMTPKQVFEFELICLQNLIEEEMEKRHAHDTR